VPISEEGFADRLQRARTVQSAIAQFDPAFDPADESLDPATFDVFLDDLDEQNTNTATDVGTYSTDVNARVDMVKDVKKRVLRVKAYVKSNVAWKNHFPKVRSLSDKIRGYRPSTPKPPAGDEPPGSPPAKVRSKGEQSYGEIEENLERLIAAVQAIPGYAPPAAELSIASLQALATSLSTKNSTMGSLSIQVNVKQRERVSGFNTLSDKISAIKEAVKSQYGIDSPEYQSIKGIKP